MSELCYNCGRSRKLAAIVKWLEENQEDVFRRGLWDAINKVDMSVERDSKENEPAFERMTGCKWPLCHSVKQYDCSLCPENNSSPIEQSGGSDD